jgi:hypothetical protein
MSGPNSADFSLVGEIRVQWDADGSSSASRAADISSTGAFIVTADPLPAGTTIGLRLEAAGREIAVQAVVRRAIPGEGMGVEFQSVSSEDHAALERMMRNVESQAAEPHNATPQNAAEAPHSASRSPAQPRSRIRNSPERRSRTRYKFSAPAEITESASGHSLSGELSDIGHFGCYVTTGSPLPVGTSVELSITHGAQTFRAGATVKSSQPDKGMGLTFGHVSDDDGKVLDGWLAVASERVWLATNRRRGQRVVVSIPVQVEAKDRWGQEHREETKTISVNAHGALLALDMELIKGQTITLRDLSSQDALECAVAYLGASEQGRREVGVSFVQPNKCLWRIAFPPADWSLQDPYAKTS